MALGSWFPRSGRRVAVATFAAVAVLAVAGCGDADDDADDAAADGADPDPAPSAAQPTSEPAPPAPAEQAGGWHECPPGPEIAAAYGATMVLSQQDAVTGAQGLLFCPYDEVVATSADTGATGSSLSARFMSITFTNLDITPFEDELVAEGQVPVAGPGEVALWEGSLGELWVWTGSNGFIVSIPIAPPSGDSLATALAVAELVIGAA